MDETSRQAVDDGAPDAEPRETMQNQLNSVQQCLLDDPFNTQALTRAGMLLHEMGRFEESEAHLARAMSGRRRSGDPSSTPLADIHAGILTQMGDCYADMSNAELAEKHYRAAGALAPHSPEPYVGLGAMALKDDRLAQAKDHFETAARLKPDCAEAYGGLAMVHQKRMDHAAAFDMHLKCLELDTDNLVALLGLFQVSCRMGTFSKIIHFLEVYLDRNPTDTSVLFCLATLYAREGRFGDARRAVLDILEREPDKQDAAILLAQLNENLITAES